MGMTFNNLCNSCTNIGCEFQSGIVRTKCAFYMPPYIEPDNCGNYVVMQPTVEAIPKDQYEARLKADLVAMLTELQLEIEELPKARFYKRNENGDCIGYIEYPAISEEALSLIEEKINALKGDSDGA